MYKKVYAHRSWHKPLRLLLEVTRQAVNTAVTFRKLMQVFQALSFWPPRSIHRVISCKCIERRKCKCSLFSKYVSTSVQRCMVGKVTWLHGREASWVVIWERRVDLTKTNVLETSNIRLMERLNLYFNILTFWGWLQTLTPVERGADARDSEIHWDELNCCPVSSGG